MTGELTHKKQTRARILDEAAREMRRSGTEGIGVSSLMSKAGLTHGGFYAHFTNRDDLVAHAVDRMLQDSRSLLHRHVNDANPAKGLSGLIDAYLSNAARLAPEDACPIPSLSGEGRRMPKAARRCFGSGIESFQSAVAMCLANSDISESGTVAWSVVSEMVGAMALARATPDEDVAQRILSAARRQLKRRLGLSRLPPKSVSKNG